MKTFALDSLIVTVANATVHLANYVVVAGIAAFFGATWQTDAFFLALAFPTFFVSAIVNAVGSVFIPIFTECKMNRPHVIGQLVGSALLYALTVTLCIAVIIAIAALRFSHWFLSDTVSVEFQQLAVQQMLLMLPVIVIQTLTGILSAFYNANEQFLIPPATDAVSTFAVLVVIAVTKSVMGIFSVPLGFVVGAVLHLLLLVLFWHRFKVKIIWKWNIDAELRRSFGLSLPLILGTAALQFGAIVTRLLAAGLPEGSLTILDYASRISYAVMELLTSGMLLVVLARWSQIAQVNIARLRQEVQQIVQMGLFIVTPIVAIILALRYPLVAFALQRGNFDASMVSATAGVLFFFLLGIPIDAIGRIYVRLFLAWQNTWVVGGLAIIRMAITAALALVFMREIGLLGIALADTIAILSITLALIVLANKRMGNAFAGSGVALIRLSVSAICAGGVSAFVARLLAGSELAVLLIGGITGCIIYVVISWLVSSEQLDSLVSTLIPHLNRRIS